MRKLLLLGVAALLLLGALMLSAGDFGFWRRYASALASGDAVLKTSHIEPRVLVEGDGPRAPPRATAEDQGLAAEAMAEALAQARAGGSRALVVHRRGHRIAETFAEGTNEATLVAGGDLARLVPALAAGLLAEDRNIDEAEALRVIDRLARAGASGTWLNPWSRQARLRFGTAGEPFLPGTMQTPPAEFVSRRLWQPLGAGDAWLWGKDVATARFDCCMVAALGDWMRLSDLLLGLGEREGERIVRSQWVFSLMPAPEPGAAPRLRWLASPAEFGGEEPPAARDTVAVDLASDLRLWLVPSRQLAVLHWAADTEAARDPAIPNILIRGITDARPASLHGGGETAIGDLVPGH